MNLEFKMKGKFFIEVIEGRDPCTEEENAYLFKALGEAIKQIDEITERVR